jgi:hypothetical protein
MRRQPRNGLLKKHCKAPCKRLTSTFAGATRFRDLISGHRNEPIAQLVEQLTFNQ